MRSSPNCVNSPSARRPGDDAARVRDRRRLTTAQDAPDVIKWIKFSYPSWTNDNLGFYYSRFPPPRTEGETGKTFSDLAGQRIYYHRLGQPQDQDRLISVTGLFKRHRPAQSGKAGRIHQASVCEQSAARRLRADRQSAGGRSHPAKAGASPIKHCIYVVKENRTYDQVFGDVKEGNGDPNLCLFGEKITPNHHKLARQFVLLDNLYCDGEVSADGHQWTMGAYATDFVEKSVAAHLPRQSR